MKVVTLSDTHGKHNKVDVPPGDVLVHAGDFMLGGNDYGEAKSFAKWFHAQPHEHKVVIAGNHDILFEKLPYVAKELFAGVHYLCDSGVTIEGVRFWGSPYTPEFYDWAFNLPRGESLKKHWDMIPDDTNVLVTHGPPYGLLDQVKSGWDHLGCIDLRKAIDKRLKQLRLHVFGHIHGGAGIMGYGGFWVNNASVLSEAYEVVRPPLQITI